MNNSPTLLLLQPRGACREFTRSGSCYPPLGLCQIAAMDVRGQIDVVDADGWQLSQKQTIDKINRIRPVAVGMTLTAYTFKMIGEYTKILHAMGFKIIIGGPEATLNPRNVLEELPDADWVFCGEPEMQVAEIVYRLRNNETLNGVRGVCYRTSPNEYHIEPNVVVDKLEQLPWPSMDNLPVDAYWCPDAKRTPMVTVMTTRGCPHRCGFCASPALLGRKVRKWTPEQVVEQIEMLNSEFGVKEISFVDDVFTISKTRMTAICKRIIDRKLNVTWFCNSRADQITLEVAEIAKEAGCHQMYLGFESGHPRILEVISKDATVEQLVRGADILKKAGIKRSVGFVVGLPTEDDESVLASIDLAHKIKPERIQFTRWTPLAGSPLYGHANEFGQTFHSGGGDKVTNWINMMYDSVKQTSWGNASW